MDTRNSKFHRGFAREVHEVESFGFKKCLQDFLGTLLTLQEVWIPPLSILGAIWLSFNTLKGLLGRFCLKGLFGKLMGYGIVPCFDSI